MFEREIKFIYDFNLNKVNKLGPYFTFEQLQSVELHPAILNYISAEIDYLVFEDRQKLLKNSVFDYSGEKIAYHFNEITEEVKKVKRFSLEYIAKLILHSTSFTVNYLVRPRWTLTRFIFDEAKYKTSNEIKQILNYVYYYKFVKKVIVSYINSKKILSMNVEEFDELINRTDKLGLESNTKGILSSSLISMAEFFNIGQMQKTKIPLTAVELFLEEKDLDVHSQKIAEAFGDDENSTFYIGDYMKVLTSVMAVQKEEEPQLKEFVAFEEDKEEEVLTLEEEYSKKDIFENVVEEEPNNFADEQEQSLDQSTEAQSELSFQSYDSSSFSSVEENIEEEIETAANLVQPKEEITLDENEQTTDEIIEPQEDYSINTNAKFRINIKEDNRLEPIADSIEEAQNEIDEELDSFSTIVKDEDENEIETDQEELAEEDEKIELTMPNSFANPNQEKEIIKFGEDDDVYEKDYSFEAEEKNEIEEEQSAYVEDDEDEVVHQKFEEQTKLELAEILEHKNMSKIIEVVFDYDIEDFANMLDEISACQNAEDAHYIINETLATRRVNKNSKEAETLREIISEYFNRR